ncbi:Succinate-semialdehyde dehydrogenase, mitochondrial [Cucurbita argyrosperma subsp. argyrosperma]|nr:Succinate-semialdehyde dehydrogenase, mitochondrial [Cucurbita argyrosperma subsp. argyrosperma]
MTMTVAARAIATARSVVRASRLRNVFTALKSQSHALLIRQMSSEAQSMRSEEQSMSSEVQSIAARLRNSGLLRSQGLIGGQWIDAYDGRTIKV